MIQALLLTVAVAVPQFSTPQDAGEQGPTLVRYDLRPLAPHFDAGSEWKESLVSGLANPWDDRPEVHVHGLYDAPPTEVLVEIVTQVLGDELHLQGRELSLDGSDGLLVLAPPATQERIRTVLDALGAALSSSVRIQLDAYTLTQGAGPRLVEKNVLTIQEADGLGGNLMSQGAQHVEHTFDLFPGRTAVLDHSQRLSLLYDYDIEIAQGAVAFDPFVVDVDLGLRVFLRGVPTDDGTILTFLVSQNELLGEVVERAVSTKGAVGGQGRDAGLEYIQGPSSAQTVDVLTRSVAASALLPEGQALVFSSESVRGGQRSRHVVVLRRIAKTGGAFHRTRLAGTSRTLMVVNGELLGAPRFAFTNGAHEYTGAGSYPYVTAVLQSRPAPFLFDWLKYRFSVWRRIGPWAVIVTDPAWDDRADQELDALIASVQAPSENVDVSVDLGLMGSGDSDTRTPVRWSLPILVGTEAAAVLGRSSTVLADYDVEVAHNATLSDPVIVPTFEGLAFALAVSRGDDALVVDARGSGRWNEQPVATFQSTGPFAGHVEELRSEALEFDERRRLKGGERVHLGARSPRSGPGSGLFVSIEVR
jgi:hypothetical protein